MAKNTQVTSSKALKAQLTQLLFADIANFWLDLYRQKYQQLVDDLASWELIQNPPADEDQATWLLLQTIAFLRFEIEKKQHDLKKLDSDYALFIERLSHAEIAAERELHILDYAQQLGATKEQLHQDKLAFSRWFDEGAVINRYQDAIADIEQTLKFLIGKLGDLSNRYLRSASHNIDKAWQTLDLDGFFLQLLSKSNNEHVKNALYRALANQVQLIHNNNGDSELSANMVETLLLSLELVSTPYLAKVDILEILIHQRPTYIRAVMEQLVNEEDKFQLADDERLFLLAALPEILINQTHTTQKCEAILAKLAAHPFERVRQSVIEQAIHYSLPFLQSLLIERLKLETVDAIRFTLVKQLSAARLAANEFAFKIWQQLLANEQPLAIKRLLLELSARMMLNQQVESNQPDAVFTQYINFLNQCLETEPNIAVRRYITRTREQLVAFAHQNIMAELDTKIPQQNKVQLPLTQIDEQLLGRLLSTRAQQSEGFNVQKNKKTWHINNGYHYAFRVWRFIHEWRNPSSDKRQSFNHSKARKPSAFMHVPSCSVAEISSTNVPAEPLFDFDEHSARPHLPLPDFLLSTLSQDNIKQPAKNYTPDGILSVTPPASLMKRLKTYLWLSLNLADLDDKRKGNEIEQQSYLTALNKQGFKFEFNAYGEQLGCQFPVEDSIAKLYKKLSISPVLINIWLSFKEYLYSIYQNSIGQLVFFVGGFALYFWGRHIRVSRQIRTDRKAIPVSIGGWGTRGKSGTERIKAALFSSLALKVITKTTGCEATLIYARSNGEQFEVPLFRPFDKASIWEQSDVLHFAKEVKADVFLWECMGLTPRYVKILRNWMNDNFSTITNAYPDHEDILGPTGIDVAKEMANFIPKQSLVFTSEQTMMPILDKDAQTKQTSLVQVHWGEGYQITPDIKALYPYEEHPDNIALVCKMAKHIGLNKDYVFRETAKKIVPDIGVLQHFTSAEIGNNRVSFVNSMSANERLATLENWRRLDLYSLSDNPDKQTIALINNRNDRVARSKVFANILAEDLPFDKMVIVGTNVDGFYSYYLQAFEERIDKVISNNDKQSLEALLNQLHLISDVTKLKATLQQAIPNTELNDIEHLDSEHKFENWLQAQCNDLNDEAMMSLVDLYKHYLVYQTILPWLEAMQQHSKQLKDALLILVKSKCILIDNAQISADQLTRQINKLARPNCHQVIIGMQNIKGVGLNYVYAWQQWQKIHSAVNRLLDPNCTAQVFKKTLTSLSLIPQFGLLEGQYLLDIIGKLKAKELAQNEYSQAEIIYINEKIKATSGDTDKEGIYKQKSHIKRFAVQVVESFLDAGAAVKRKKIANQVYKDIANQRITLEKAIDVLAKLNRNQKPGWLTFSGSKK